MRLSVNLIANQTFFPMESEVPDDVVPKAIAAKYRLASGQGAMRPAELGTTGSFVPGVAYRVDDDGHLIRDARTAEVEAANTQAQLEAEDEVWNSIFLNESERSSAAQAESPGDPGPEEPAKRHVKAGRRTGR